jgi:4a-hydroxytetrahydrobiopterin dehydratase
MTRVLPADELASALTQLPEWSGDTGSIVRSVVAPTFIAGIRLVDAVAAVAEAVNHHPDIDIRWRTVTFRLSTHVAGGVTKYDLGLAQQIDDVVRQQLRQAGTH